MKPLTFAWRTLRREWRYGELAMLAVALLLAVAALGAVATLGQRVERGILASATELIGQKLNALEEHACDFGRQLPVARAVREQVDWDEVRAVTADNPFATAFLFLLERLAVVEPGGTGS